MPPVPESGEPEPEDDLSPDEPESSLPPVDSEDDKKEEEDEDEEVEEHPMRKRDRETVDLEDGDTSHSHDPTQLEVPISAKPLRSMPPLVETSGPAPKKAKAYAAAKTFGALVISS